MPNPPAEWERRERRKKKKEGRGERGGVEERIKGGRKGERGEETEKEKTVRKLYIGMPILPQLSAQNGYDDDDTQ